MLHSLVTALGFGIVISSVLAVAALGFDLTFAVSGLLNIGFIAFMLVGQFVAYGVYDGTHVLWLAALAAGAAGSIFGVTLNRSLVAPFLRRATPAFVIVLVLFSLYTFVTGMLSYLFSSGTYSIPESTMLTRPVHIAGMLFTEVQVIVILGAALVVLLVDGVLRYTTLGRDIRAMSDDRDLAGTKGVRVVRIADITWGVSGFLGGLAGVALALVQVSFATKSDQSYFVLVTAAAFLGGAGKPYGALVGAILVGVSTQVAAIWVPSDLSPLLAFVALIVIISFRPGGILGSVAEGFRP